MRIGIMLRHVKQHAGGVKVYTKELLPRLLELDTKNQYVLMYQDRDLVGTYNHLPNVEEIALPIPGTLAWDQIAAPLISYQKNLDVIFNMKFTVPFLARGKKIFILHGFEWFTIPETFRWFDRMYNQICIPIYSRAASKVITVAKKIKSDAVRYTVVNPDKFVPVYYGFDKSRFRVIDDQAHLDAVREKYQLPENFIVWVGQIYPPKNVGRLFQALAQIRNDVPHKLVIAGEQRWRADETLKFVKELNLEDRVQFSGWVSHDDLPAFYNMASLFAFPSLYEGFGIPLLEAMACGCPILTSTTGTPPEITAGAARLVNPLSVDDIATGLREVLTNEPELASMRAKGLQRAEPFSWDQCAKETLALLNSLDPQAAPRERVLETA